MKLVHGQTKGAAGPMVTAGVAATVVATVVEAVVDPVAAEVVDPVAKDSEDTKSLVITYAPVRLPFTSVIAGGQR